MYHLREGTTGMGGFIKYGLGHGESFVHFTGLPIVHEYAYYFSPVEYFLSTQVRLLSLKMPY